MPTDTNTQPETAKGGGTKTMATLRQATVEKAAKLISEIVISDAIIQQVKIATQRLNTDSKTYIFDLAELDERMTKAVENNRAAVIALAALEKAEMESSSIKVISMGKKKAQIVIQNKEANGDKTSITKHLTFIAGQWHGYSLLTGKLTIYKLPAQSTDALPVAA